MSILTALCLISPLAAGYSWEGDPEDWYYDPLWNNSHEILIPLHQLDGELSYALVDGECELVESIAYTYNYPGTNQSPVIIDKLPGFLVFHVNCELFIDWTENAPEGATSMEITASINLYRETTPNNWVFQCNDNYGWTLFGEDQWYNELWLHVLEERIYQHNDNYKITFQVNGHYWEGSTYIPLESANEETFYRINDDP